jgi:hypothetical protein
VAGDRHPRQAIADVHSGADPGCALRSPRESNPFSGLEWELVSSRINCRVFSGLVTVCGHRPRTGSRCFPLRRRCRRSAGGCGQASWRRRVLVLEERAGAVQPSAAERKNSVLSKAFVDRVHGHGLAGAAAGEEPAGVAVGRGGYGQHLPSGFGVCARDVPSSRRNCPPAFTASSGPKSEPGV